MKKRSLTKMIQTWGVVFLLGIGASVIVFDMIKSYQDFNFRAAQLRADYTASRKQLIKQQVEHVVAMIYQEKIQSEALAKQEIKCRVYEAFAIAQHIYRQNVAGKRRADIQNMIINAIRPIRFAAGAGYYFISRLDGVAILFPSKPEWEGKTLTDVRDGNGQYLTQQMIRIVQESGEGYYSYSWTKPREKENTFNKIAFVKSLGIYDWFIGAGLYVDDVEARLKSDLLAAISRIRFGKEGYIFVNRFNGDALVSNGKIFSGDKKLWEVFDKNPEAMRDVFNKEYQAAMKPQGDYIYYSHVKLSDPDKESPKASFIYGIPEWKWLVGAGVYLDDVEVTIAAMQRKLNQQIRKKMVYYVLITIAIVAFFLFLFSRLNRRLKNDFRLFVSFFNQAAHSDEPIDRQKVQFHELDRMAEYANKMLADRRQAEKALQKLEKLKSVGTLAGGIAHDFNNILTGVFGNVSIAKSMLPPGHPGAQSLHEAEESMHRAIRLTKQLLTFAKGGAPVTEITRLDQLVAEIVRFDLSGSNVKLVFNCADGLWPAEVDKGQMQQVFSNLTINARQAMPDGGRLYITLENAIITKTDIPELTQGKYVRVTVRDEGCGIAQDHVDKIFEPYFTTKPDGNGLGLATAHSIVGQHGGCIQVDARPGQGATFTLYLPAADSLPPQDTTEPAGKSEAKVQAARILIMDDEEPIRKVAAEILLTGGYAADSAADGRQAVAMYRRALREGRSYDLVIMDLTIRGGLGGKEAVREILAINPRAKVIVSSGYANDPIMANYSNYGFSGVIAKPYTMSSLLKVVEDILNQ